MSNTNTQQMEVQTSTAPQTGLSVFQESNFNQMCQVATMMAKTSLIPESLKGESDEETVGNCFLVVEQAQRWSLSPFAVAQCASVVHGRLMWEGKLVSAVLSANLGVNLHYDFSGSGETMSVVVSGQLPGEDEPRTVNGTVGGWKTAQWKAVDYEQRLSYRGAREWARRHASAVMLGVTTEDEELPKKAERNVTPMAKPIDPFNAAPSLESDKGETQEAKKPEASSTEVSATAPKAPKGQKGEAVILAVNCEEGVTGDRKWTRYDVRLKTSKAEITATTFSTRIGGLADFNVNQRANVWVERSEKGFTLSELEILDVSSNNDEGGIC